MQGHKLKEQLSLPDNLPVGRLRRTVADWLAKAPQYVRLLGGVREAVCHHADQQCIFWCCLCVTNLRPWLCRRDASLIATAPRWWTAVQRSSSSWWVSIAGRVTRLSRAVRAFGCLALACLRRPSADRSLEWPSVVPVAGSDQHQGQPLQRPQRCRRSQSEGGS